jgi:hypothetical protein
MLEEEEPDEVEEELIAPPLPALPPPTPSLPLGTAVPETPLEPLVRDSPPPLSVPGRPWARAETVLSAKPAARATTAKLLRVMTTLLWTWRTTDYQLRNRSAMAGRQKSGRFRIVLPFHCLCMSK